MTFITNPPETIIVLKDRNGKIMKPKSDKVYEIPAGIYSYTASAEGYTSSEVDRIDIVEDRQINIELISLSAWGIATDEQISNMLNLHYEGKINIGDYWAVGDTRTVHLNAIPNGTGASENHVAQDMTMVIIGIEHDDLKTPINGKSKAAITVQCREMLGNKGNKEDGFYSGQSDSKIVNTDNYLKSNRRTWFNGAFINAMPNTFNTLIKTVNKKNLTTHTGKEVENSEDKAFLLSYPEVFGTSTYKDYLDNNDVGTYEGTQYKYYQTTANRIKYVNNDGSKESSANHWWLRSPSSNYNNTDGYRWCYVNSSGKVFMTYGASTLGLAPAFCL